MPPGFSRFTILVKGAQGGNIGGLGASVQGDFVLAPGTTLQILVGEQPPVAAYGGGGGGTFVAQGATAATATPLIVAGGGGGVLATSYQASHCPGFVPSPANILNIETTGSGAGTSGYGSSPAACGGGGFYFSGAADTTFNSRPGNGFRQGGALALPTFATYVDLYPLGYGGFGGGEHIATGLPACT